MSAARRILLPLVVAVAALAAPGQPLARGGDYVFDGGTPAQQASARAALNASSFDWGVVPAPITIHVRPAIVSHATRGHVWVAAELLDSGRFGWSTVQDEYAHQIDFFLFDDGRRAELTRALGAKDWCYGVRGLAHHEYGCERFSSTLVWTFWQSKDNAYRPTSPSDEAAALPPAKFRALLAQILRR